MSSRQSSSFKLRFPVDQIPFWASRYNYPGETEIVNEIAPRARSRGYLLRDEFVQIARWKTPRSQPRILKNDGNLIESVTRTAFSAFREEIRIGLLLILDGVSWPTASVILHLCTMDDYPILDFRALWSLRVPVPSQYSFPFWWDYTTFVRQLKKSSRFDMRTIDRALWQYSSERQPARRGV